MIITITLLSKELSEIDMTPLTFRKITPFAREVEAEVQVESEPYKNHLGLRTIRCLQLLADGQRLCLESRERVVAALRSRIHCEYHALAAVASRSVCSLATMDPDRVPLIGKRPERAVSSIMWESIFEGNTYVGNNEFTGGKGVVISTQRNRDAMWYDDIRKHAV